MCGCCVCVVALSCLFSCALFFCVRLLLSGVVRLVVSLVCVFARLLVLCVCVLV